MKRPPFKIDGRGGGMIRAERLDSNVFWWQTGRLSLCWDRYAQAVLTGTAAPEGEMRMLNGPWHRVAVTPEEARELLLARMGGALTVRKCEAARARRELAGA